MHQRAGGAAGHEAPAMEMNVPHNLPELRLQVKDESPQAGSRSLESFPPDRKVFSGRPSRPADLPSADAPASLRPLPST